MHGIRYSKPTPPKRWESAKDICTDMFKMGADCKYTIYHAAPLHGMGERPSLAEGNGLEQLGLQVARL